MTGTKNHDAVVERRYDFVFLFDVQDGNPNGDPDAGNLPRLDPQSLQGYVTDVCIKRKIRDAVATFCEANSVKRVGGRAIEIYMKHQGILANEQRRAFESIEAEPSASPNLKARAWMCKNFYDVRVFGAVMTTGKTSDDATAQKEGKKKWNCGQVRGPVQITFSRSIDQIVPVEVPITRVALTNPGDTKVATSIDAETGEEKAGSGQFARKSIVPYALYRGYGFINPLLAKDTGFTFGDLRLFFESMVRMFDLDRSASRGLMALRKVVVFEHASALGSAPAHLLFDRVKVPDLGPDKPPRKFGDYNVTIDRTDLSAGITIHELPEQLDQLIAPLT
jgi:CRISPR-associated protein Csd2